MSKTGRQAKAERFSPIRINTKFRKKLVVLFFAAILALVALVGRITYINVTRGEDYRRIVLSNIQQQYESRTLPFKRGDITDRNGTLLATSERVYNLVLDCTVVNYETEDDDGNKIRPYREPTLNALVKQFHLAKKDIEKILDTRETQNSQYQILVHDVTMAQREEWENYVEPPEDLPMTKEERLERASIHGVWFEESYKRIYPQNSLACDLIGFTYAVNEASWGIEGYYSDTLNGVNGRRFGYFNSDADVQQTIIEPVNGNNVISTIDINIQEIIREAIQAFETKYSTGPKKGVKGAKNICVIVMDPNNGEILGMDSNNWYDLNDPRDLSGILNQADLANMTDEEKVEKMNEIWRNFCVSDAYEPGSVVKPLTVAAALETASITEKDRFECDGGEEVRGTYVKCAIWPDVHGKLDFYGAIANSCNDCIMQIVKKEGYETYLKYFSYFNFGEDTGIDLPGENPGIVYTENNMGEMELATASFGQGFTCTMIQEASAIASLINGGYYYRPHVVSAVTDETGNIVERVDAVVERQTVSKKTSDMIKTAMGKTITEGTGEYTRITGYSMGAKTGTAEKLPRGTGDYLTSFIGFAPLNDPRVLVYVIVDEPNVAEQDSSLFAQEVARDILVELLPYLGLFPDAPEVVGYTPGEEEEYYYEEPEETPAPLPSGLPGLTGTPGTTPAPEGEQPSEETQPGENGQPAGEGETPGEGQPAGEGETPGDGQPAGEGEVPGEGQDTGEGEVPGDGQDTGEGEVPNDDQDTGEGEVPDEGQPADEGEMTGDGQGEIPEDTQPVDGGDVPEDGESFNE